MASASLLRVNCIARDHCAAVAIRRMLVVSIWAATLKIVRGDVRVWMRLKAKQKRCSKSSDWSVMEKGKSRMGSGFGFRTGKVGVSG